MASTIRAGIFYFALVFGMGFLLGTLRNVLMHNGIASRGVLVWLEIPLLVAYAWWAAGWVCRRLSVATATSSRLLVGAVMLVLLRIGEMVVGALLMGQGMSEQFRALTTLSVFFELLPQLLTASFPLLRARLFE